MTVVDITKLMTWHDNVEVAVEVDDDEEVDDLEDEEEPSSPPSPSAHCVAFSPVSSA